MIKKITISFILSLVTIFASAATIDLRGKESTRLTDGKIEVGIKIDRLQTNSDCSSAASWRWGSERACPVARIASLEMLFQGKAVFIPISVFSDLGNPTSIEIEQNVKSQVYSLKIRGGDAADSYTAIIKFKSKVLIERGVFSGEFPDDSWEKTTYKFNF